MAHRPDDVETQNSLHEATAPADLPGLRIADLEPMGGLVAACARLSMELTPAQVLPLSDGAQDALSAIQSILWRLEHAPVAPATSPPPE